MPNVIRLQKDFFTKLWGEGFVEVNHVPDPNFLPSVSKQHFESYLKKLLKVKALCHTCQVRKRPL